MISKVTTIPILIRSSPIAIWGEGKYHMRLIFNHPVEFVPVMMKTLLKLSLNKALSLNMAKVENDLDISQQEMRILKDRKMNY